MTNKTELSEVKRLIFDIASDRDDKTVTDANMLIRESVESAFTRLSKDDQVTVARNALALQARCPKLSEAGALEVLAAIGQYWSEESR